MSDDWFEDDETDSDDDEDSFDFEDEDAVASDDNGDSDDWFEDEEIDSKVEGEGASDGEGEGASDGEDEEDVPSDDISDSDDWFGDEEIDSDVEDEGVSDVGDEDSFDFEDEDAAPSDDISDSDDWFGEDAADDLFSEDFSAAFENAPGIEGIGGGDAVDLPSESTFDDEPLDSDLPRIDIGIEGLDEMIQGGVPERSLLTVIGGAGTGKTTFAIQFLNEALREGDRAIYISLEESQDRIVNSAEEKGIPFEQYVAEDRLSIVDLDPIEMANSLRSIRSELPKLISVFGANRLVLDSVSLLEMMYDSRSARRNGIFDFTRSLKKAGVTTLLTSEASADNPYESRYGIAEYLTDGVIILQFVRPDDFRETRLAIEVQKIRDCNHSREMKPYEITNDGINVYRQANIF